MLQVFLIMCAYVCIFIAELCLKSRRNDEAAREYWSLLDRNPENGAYYNGLVEAHNLCMCDNIL